VTDAVLVERRDGVQIITVNRPGARDALDEAVGDGTEPLAKYRTVF
jgi:enoyl-CoA hydratase